MITADYIKCDICGGIEELDALEYAVVSWVEDEDGRDICPLCQKELEQGNV